MLEYGGAKYHATKYLAHVQVQLQVGVVLACCPFQDNRISSDIDSLNHTVSTVLVSDTADAEDTKKIESASCRYTP